MLKNKSQHNEFSYNAMPGLFHRSTEQFMQLLERDGMKFLNFWWDTLGKKKSAEKLMSSKGLAYEMRTLEDGTAVILLTMPPPQIPKSAYFIALVYKPIEQKGMVKKQATHVFTLDRMEDEHGKFTVVGEVTPRLVYHDLGEGPAPNLDLFFDAVCRALGKKTSLRDVLSLK